jgi:hypothetical protein
MLGGNHHFLVLLYQQLSHLDFFRSGLIIGLVEALELLDDVNVGTLNVAVEVDYLLLIVIERMVMRFYIL